MPLYPTECGAAAAAMVKLNRVCETQPPSVGVNVYCSCGLRAALPPPRLATSSRLHAHINNRQHEKGWVSCVNADNCQSQTSTTTDSAWPLETQSKCLTCSDAGLAGAEKAVAASQTERFKCARVCAVRQTRALPLTCSSSSSKSGLAGAVAFAPFPFASDHSCDVFSTRGTLALP